MAMQTIIADATSVNCHPLGHNNIATPVSTRQLVCLDSIFVLKGILTAFPQKNRSGGKQREEWWPRNTTCCFRNGHYWSFKRAVKALQAHFGVIWRNLNPYYAILRHTVSVKDAQQQV